MGGKGGEATQERKGGREVVYVYVLQNEIIKREKEGGR